MKVIEASSKRMKFKWILISLGALVLFGCAKEDSKGIPTAQGGGLPIEKGSNSSSTAPTAPNSTSKERLGEIASKMNEEQTKNLKIKTNAELGYSASNPQVSTNLGTKVDDAMEKMGSAWIKARVELKVGDGMTSSTPESKILDKSHFLIQYINSEFPDEVGRVVKNGDAAVQLAGGKFIKAVESAPAEIKTKDQVFSWFGKASYRVYDSIRTGSGSFESLIRALNNPSLGFETEVSEQKMAVNSDERMFYRLISKDDSGFECELVIDSLRYVPVTIRSTVKGKDGAVLSQLWTAQWQFDGQFDKSEFAHPKVK